MTDKTGIALRTDLPPALQNAIMMWADATTDATSRRRHDLLRDKGRALTGFFEQVKKRPDQVTAIDVKTWQAELENRGLSAASVYARISRISSFYEWAMTDDTLAAALRANPVKLARPKAPKAYHSESTKALTLEDATALVNAVKAKADGGDVVGKRDFALLLFYFTTGMRRSEVINLTWGDVQINGTITITAKVKGGDYENRAINSPQVKTALLDYLETSGRLETMTGDDPLWIRHDPNSNGQALTSHGYVKNFKRYAKQAGLGDIHLHMTRHTYARLVGDESGSVIEVQDALGHKNLATTKVYLQRIGVKRDKYSSKIAERLGL